MHGVSHVVCICGQSAIIITWWHACGCVSVHAHTVQNWVGESSACKCIGAAHCYVVYWCVLPCGGNHNAVSSSSKYMSTYSPASGQKGKTSSSQPPSSPSRQVSHMVNVVVMTGKHAQHPLQTVAPGMGLANPPQMEWL